MITDTFVSLPICNNCGAKATRLDARFCAYCRAELSRLESNETRSRESEVSRRFSEFEAHPEYPRLQAFQPVDAGKAGPGTVVFGGVFLVMWITIGGMVTLGFAAIGGPLVLFPLAILCFGLFGMARSANEYRAFRRAPIVPQPALVVDERVQVTGGENSSARTQYYTTLEYPGGQREEFETIPPAAAQACPGDIGMAYVRAKTLVHFERVPV